MPTFVIPNSFGTSPLREENPCHEPGGSPVGGRFAHKGSGSCPVTPPTKTHKKKKGENVLKVENVANADTVKYVLGDVDVNEVAKGMVADVEWDQPFEISIKTHGGPFDDRMPGYFVHNLQGQYTLLRNLQYRFRAEASLEEQAQPMGFQTWIKNTPEFKEWAQKNYKAYGMDAPSVVISLGTPNSEVTAMRVFRRKSVRDLDGNESTYLSVDHHYFEVSDAVPTGLGRQLFRGSIEEYEKLGVERISTHANIDVGGYAWARYGFSPADPSEVLGIIAGKIQYAQRHLGQDMAYSEKVWDPATKTRVSRIVRAKFTDKTLSALSHLLTRIADAPTNSDSLKKAFWATIDAHVPGQKFGAGGGAGAPGRFSIGKWLMLDTDWEAQFDMHDPMQVRRMRRYLYGNS